MLGLYIHIPFCVRKCSYCDFYSLPSHTNTIASYIQAVLLEAQKYSPVSPLAPSRERDGVRGDSIQCYAEVPQNPSFQTLYLGGGTPSLLGPKNLTTLIADLITHFVIPAKAGIHSSVGSGLEPDRPAGRGEFTLPCHSERSEESSSPNSHCESSPEPVMLVSSPLTGEDQSEGVQLLESTSEVNPESATPEFLQTVKNLGFTRLSFGAQSLNDNELRSVGRIHTAKQAIAAIKIAQKLNFKSISADLIIGLPGQTDTSLHKSLQTLVGMGIQHLSVYCLSLEAGTPLANNPPPDLPTDDLQATLFEETRNYLKTCGFAHYEISNFALPGYECLHNLNYWRGGEYLGLGPAAASHLNGKRFKNRANLDAYLENPTAQIEDIEELTAKDKAAEEAILRLRLLEEGLDSEVFTKRFGQENAHDIFTRLDKMVQEGLLIQESTRYRLEPSRIMTSNPIFARVLGDGKG